MRLIPATSFADKFIASLTPQPVTLGRSTIASRPSTLAITRFSPGLATPHGYHRCHPFKNLHATILGQGKARQHLPCSQRYCRAIATQRTFRRLTLTCVHCKLQVNVAQNWRAIVFLLSDRSLSSGANNVSYHSADFQEKDMLGYYRTL